MRVNIGESSNPDSMPSSMLVSAAYDGVSKKALLKFYDPESKELYLWWDETGHKPYCYSKLSLEELGYLKSRSDILDISRVEKYSLADDCVMEFSKITAGDPLAIGGRPYGDDTERSIRDIIEAWESDIKYYETYLYDRQIVVGRYYKAQAGRLEPVDVEISDEVNLALKSLLWDKVDSGSMVDEEGFRKCISDWADLLNQPIPEIKRLSVDIEVESVEGRLPDSKIADNTVTAIGLAGTDGFGRVLVLKMPGTPEGTNELGPDIKVAFYEPDCEAQMIRDAFEIMESYPFILTYNGDDFDLPYLYNRASRLGIKNEDNPLHMLKDSATIKRGIHIDLYKTMSNRSFQIYAFGQKYTDFSLNSVSVALLGKQKIDYGLKFDEMSLYQTANYCYHDALLTYELTSFGDGILMNLLVTISRIGRMPIDDIARLGVSQWIRSLLYYEHRVRNCIIPKRDELARRTEDVTADAVIKDKKYRGGLVVEPQSGVHFDVVVMDFASLYPSIIKVRNLSYETVRCPHPECRKNSIPQTKHWSCSKRNGITSMIIGSLRDLRVNYYKSLSRKETLTEVQRQQYTAVSQALKVILNASYGVMGADIFPLYFLPAAEATTAIGRHTILETIKKCKDAGVDVLYGDTDSLFVKSPTAEQVQYMIDEAKKDHGVDLEIDKEYKYCVLSNRKKNYLGVSKSGQVDVKGLTGKKSHTPPFIRKLFADILGVLAGVQSPEEFEQAKDVISKMIQECGKKIENLEIPLDEMAFSMMLSKAPSEYTKTQPQHVRAARQLDGIRKLKRGDRISFVKTIGKPGVRPLETARKSEIDTTKYAEFLESTIEQVTSTMDMDFDVILKKPKQAGLDQFFWG
ncbi:MAG: DNA-directed DNA polymerase I [Nitrosopumilaceae archaeon]|nr:DNA-directed DNA polymerase I [Nitrosopumilaceae archaeon]